MTLRKGLGASSFLVAIRCRPDRLRIRSGRPIGSIPSPTPGLSSSPEPTVIPSSATEASSARPSLPDCRYDDVPVVGDPATDWATLVVDTIYRLPKRYVPDDLVGTARAGLNGGFKVSRVMLDDLDAMAGAARDAGTPLAVQSAYRSYQYQVSTFAGWVARSSEAEARKVSARPGHSEHQLGTALDFRSADDATPPWELDDFAATGAGGWLHDHAWEYGFVMSYPKGGADETLLRLRAVALPLRRPRRGLGDPRERPGPAALPVGDIRSERTLSVAGDARRPRRAMPCRPPPRAPGAWKSGRDRT